MLPNNSTEATPQAPTGGTEQQPASSPSGDPQSQPLPEYVTALQSQIADLRQAFRTTQGSADAQFSEMRNGIKRILELKDQGLNESQINRELFLDQLMSRQSAPVPQAAGPAKPDTGLDAESIVKSLQFAPNDPALAALRIKHQGNNSAFVAAAADLRLQQLTSPNPSPASGLSPSGNPNTGMSEAQVDEKLLQLNELYKNATRNKPQINALETELRNAGVIR